MKFKFIQKFLYSKFEKKRIDKVCDPLPIFPSIISYDTNIKNVNDFNKLCDTYSVDYYQVKPSKTVKEKRKKIDKKSVTCVQSFTDDLTTIMN